MPPTVQISLPNGQAYAQPTGLFINNEFVDASGDEFTVINPATEQCIIKLHGASSQDIGKAVHSADTAFEGPWADLAAGERGALLYKIAALIDRDRDLLAAIDAYDNDKVRQENILLLRGRDACFGFYVSSYVGQLSVR